MSKQTKEEPESLYKYDVTCERGHAKFKIDCSTYSQLLSYLKSHLVEVLVETSMTVVVTAGDNLITRIHFGALTISKVKSALSSYQ